MISRPSASAVSEKDGKAKLMMRAGDSQAPQTSTIEASRHQTIVSPAPAAAGTDAVPVRDRRSCGSLLPDLGHWPKFLRATSTTSKVQKSSTLSEAGSPSSCPDTV